MASAKRNEVMKFGDSNSDCTLAADGFTVGGAIMAPLGKIGLRHKKECPR